MAKRGSRKRRRSLGARLILIIALILMIAGFLTRRILIPAQRNLPHAHPERYGAAGRSAGIDAATPARNPDEQLDYRGGAKLAAIIRNQTRASG